MHVSRRASDFLYNDGASAGGRAEKVAWIRKWNSAAMADTKDSVLDILVTVKEGSGDVTDLRPLEKCGSHA